MENQSPPTGLVTLPRPVPAQAWMEPVQSFMLSSLAVRPLQPPTWDRPMMVTGMRAATMTKNCMTSL